MGRRGRSSFRGKPSSSDAFGRDAQDRTRIAQVAARLISEHGLTDWSLAKRKAARQLMVPALAAQGVGYAARPPASSEPDAMRAAELLIETSDQGLRLSILTPHERRQRPRRDGEPRLTADALAELLET